MHSALWKKTEIARLTFRCWLAVLFVLPGLLGLLALQSCALPDESPGATIRRLTGLAISPVFASAHEAGMSSGEASGMVPGHHHMAGDMAGVSGHHHHHMPGSGDEPSCPLCPLIHLQIFILCGCLIALLVSRLRRPALFSPLHPRAPPGLRLTGVPPARGPPSLPCFRLPAGFLHVFIPV
ncbi:hypothetical protein LOC54_09710 [Acetobacter sp. AN02]|uniref:hypothetical protein n=1 Tax=Acetobacter sp. AN02 TaxID=2894186 RepID=UPI00243415A6|nr:hypothetical protein [Acetobacter sp. AN02]MDG6095374.1 hypothetical protein [Acetobacter sp. AN02]